ncbi:hypothetical protein D6C84_08360 [Aureobasidium pullulans]|uniref:Uncharacterized protein n=1 Tax=Aureobasidium pullulans TaxID=5580 RepID=A0A4S9XJ59_AURPU|nr:hypothetical protein D6C84_08360 [Aureobasidium pullulans]
MRSSLFAVAAAVAAANAQGAQPAPSSTVVADPGTLPLGAECARTEQCAGGAQCFASNFMQITSCGKFNAACENDSQCATNTCNNGLCNGILASSLWLMPTSTSQSFSSASAMSTSTPQGALPAPSSTVVAAPNSLPLGANCANSEQCAGDVECFASNFMQITQCGKFNAACKNDSQCATNTCNNGLCNGFLASSAYLANTASSTQQSASAAGTATAATGGIQPAPSSTVVAAAGSLPLGAECASTEQCANGADCFASTAWQIKSCGKFNSACTSDSQCATNTCNNGLCNGFLASSAYLANQASTSSAAPISTVSAAAGSLALGAACANSQQCSNGAQCASSAAYQDDQTPTCGAFNTTCSSDAQCATNTCFKGLCNGYKGGVTLTTSTRPAGAAYTASGSLVPLGKSCNATSQCINGAECTVSSAYQEFAAGMVCGPYNATCSSSSQCSYNSCFNGRCTGVQGYEYSTSTAVISGKTTIVAGTAVPAASSASSGLAAAGNATRSATSTLAAYTGAAGKVGAEAGFAAAVLGAVAFLL